MLFNDHDATFGQHQMAKHLAFIVSEFAYTSLRMNLKMTVAH